MKIRLGDVVSTTVTEEGNFWMVSFQIKGSEKPVRYAVMADKPLELIELLGESILGYKIKAERQ